MAGVREEKRESMGRRDEERRRIQRESRRFLEGVEEGRRVEGMKSKREGKMSNNRKGEAHDGEGEKGEREVKRTWRQTEVKGRKRAAGEKEVISEDVKAVLGKIF
jgi:hypothetical protein